MPGPSDYPGKTEWPTNSKTIIAALKHGYVVVSAGLRGWPTTDSDGNFIGKAPAFIVDMKAAIRFVKFNTDIIFGDTDRIIPNGTSAGGATAALAGTAGNAPYFDSALSALGAAPATDDIFAVSSYCPIHNLEHADAAYEWEFSGINDWYRQKITGPLDHPVFTPWQGTLSETEQHWSYELKQQFITYLNSLHLTDTAGHQLDLDTTGNGSFKNLIIKLLMASAQRAVDAGVDVHKYQGIKVEAGRVVGVDWSAYLKSLTRMKAVPAFDDLNLESPETHLFGDHETSAKHFTAFGQTHSQKPSVMAPAELIAAVNPITYIGQSDNIVAKHWRIRHGAADRDTSFAIPTILAVMLQNSGAEVDFQLPWDTPHSGDYDLAALFAWIDQICHK